jgi:hypothetical protein
MEMEMDVRELLTDPCGRCSSKKTGRGKIETLISCFLRCVQKCSARSELRVLGFRVLVVLGFLGF